ncbi:6-phosphogluconolactonase [Actimicrobium sp. CCI2.3]|uniref:6-phosphogluconolactonase n=1 Tax=Actimicrobium sp. CCI2.3 TaxID=3048616 RepID=UPI002AB45CD0|nr:6-phosphogluconolactonase [Actimicrobium sp. CCI2.3]MDY7573192.1 6-phosphogluconolactonase [Actimicrobium sp. CCI2.3]MEB0022171.1 6-phosphogluconolactonase [Actimicrobium sp. CCI2.3]
MTVQFHFFEEAGVAAQALADAVRGDLQQALESAPRALLLVSGGRSPLPLFALLASQPLPWAQIDVSLVDERCVPLADADSNSALVARHLLVGSAAAARWVPLVDEALASHASDEWAVAQQAGMAANHNAALAQAAVVILGLGNDGHTASLFVDAPQWDEARQTSARYVALQPQAAPHARVGLSLQALIGQRHCYVWSCGADKLATLERLVALVRDAPTQPTDHLTDHLADAGPLALLIAHPKVTLHVFHSAR